MEQGQHVEKKNRSENRFTTIHSKGWTANASTRFLCRAGLPRYNGYFISFVGLLQKCIQVTHHPLKGTRHEIQSPIREDNGIFLKFSKILLGNNLIGQPVAIR